MTYKYRTDSKWIAYLLKKEYRIRNRLHLYLMTDNENTSENLGVVTTKTG